MSTMSSIPLISATHALVATHPSTPWAPANPQSTAKSATTAPRFKVGGSHDQDKVQRHLSQMRGPISTTEFNAHDVVALCHLPPLAITLPNVGWVPHPFLFEDKPVQARADGHFGTVDIYQWPQLYDDRWPWSVAIMWNLGIFPSNSPILWAWYNPVYEDFEPIRNSTLKIGFLKKETIMGLHGLFNEVRKHLSQFKGEHLQNAKNDQSARSALRHLK
jgi:hypothetical protein